MVGHLVGGDEAELEAFAGASMAGLRHKVTRKIANSDSNLQFALILLRGQSPED